MSKPGEGSAAAGIRAEEGEFGGQGEGPWLLRKLEDKR